MLSAVIVAANSFESFQTEGVAAVVTDKPLFKLLQVESPLVVKIDNQRHDR
jgi:hypothetical protein